MNDLNAGRRAFSGAMLALPLLTVARPSHADTPKRGGTLTVLSISDINSLNPALASGAQVMMPGAQMFAGLVEYTDSWEPHPYLAERWEVSGDGMTYTFHLVKDALFHDGAPVTAEDVAFSIQAVKENHPFGKQMYANVTEIQTPDPHTAVIKLSTPTAALLLSLSPHFTPILPKHVYGGQPLRTNPKNNTPVGSGPFKFASYKPGTFLALDRFDKFFRKGKPYLDHVVFSILKGSTNQGLALSRGDVQYSPYPPFGISEILRLKKNPGLTVTDKGNQGIGWIVWLEFNLRKAPFNNVSVRQAISYAIDRKFIREKLQSGLSRPATSPITSSSPFYDPSLNPYDLNLDKANQLLDQAGFKKKADGMRFSVTLNWLPVFTDYYQTVAEYLRIQLRKVGIDVQLRPSPDLSTWAQRVSNWEYDMDISSSYNYGDPTIGVQRTYVSSNIRKGIPYSNVTGYSNPRVDQLLDEAAKEIDPAKRKADYFEFQKIVNTDVPLAILFEVPVYTIYNDHVKNVPLGIWGGLVPYDNIYLAK